MKTPLLILPLAVASLALSTSSVRAAAQGSDVASNYTTATWITGSNLGSGFGAWTIDSNVNFNEGITNSNGNGGSPNINTSNVAFKIQRAGSFSQIERGFAVGGPNNSNQLDAGQSFKFSLDLNPFLVSETGQSVGFWLTDSGSGERWGLQYNGGSGANLNLILKTNGGANQNTGISVSGLNSGINVTFNLLAAGAWTASIEKLDGSGTFNLSSSTFGTLAASPTGFRFFVAANSGTKNQYLNNIAVVPEPAAFAGLGLALGVVAVMRRRRRLQS